MGIGVERPGWLVATAVVTLFAVTGLLNALWAAFVEHEWWQLPVVPVGVLFYGWIIAGCWRRAQGRPAPNA
jgi:hypothetical protein